MFIKKKKTVKKYSCESAVTSLTRHKFQGAANELLNWTMALKIDEKEKKVGKMTPFEWFEIIVAVIDWANVVRLLGRYYLIHTLLHQLHGLKQT